MFDLNGDGVDDVVASGEAISRHLAVRMGLALLLVGNRIGTFSDTPELLAEGFGSLLQLVDLDGDGDQDIVSGEYFHPEAVSMVRE